LKLKTHRAIANVVAHALGLNDSLRRVLVEGSVAPDKFPEETWRMNVSRSGHVYFRKTRVRHHASNHDLIMKYVWRARRSWLLGDYARAVYLLGWTLHYIQDACVKNSSWDNHSQVEAEIARNHIPLETMEYALTRSVSSPKFVRKVVYSLNPRYGREALQEAAIASAMIASAVLGPADPPSTLIHAHSEEHRKHVKKTVLEAICVAGGLLACFTFPAAALPLFAAALAAYAADDKYRELREEMAWFSSP